MVVVTSGTATPPVVDSLDVVVCVKVCVGDAAANSLSVWNSCDWLPTVK